MARSIRKSGIDVLDDVPWGAHLCQFYHTKEDLIEILVPYFKAGLENNEFCMWVTSEPLQAEEAKAALKKAVKNLNGYIKKGQIEILDYHEWYTRSGKFNADEVLQGWLEKEKLALQKGFDGLRLTGNTFWIEREDWKGFSEYEATVDRVIGQYHMLAICTYSLDKCGIREVLDVISNHQSALIRQLGKWEIVESAERKRSKEGLRRAEDNFRNSLDESPLGIRIVSAEGETLYANRAILDIYGYDSIEEMEATPSKKRYTPESYAEHRKRVEKRQRGEYVPSNYEIGIVRKDDKIRHLEVFRKEVLWNGKTQFQVLYNDITERKRVEHQLRERMKELRALYSLAEITQREGITLDELYQECADILSESWQYPEIAYASIVISDSEFRTKNFTESAWKQSAPVKVNGSLVGRIEVGYLEERPEESEGPFTKEERLLIDAIAKRLGRITERKRVEKALKESEERFRMASQIASDVVYERDLQTGIATFYGDIDSHLGYGPGEYPRTMEGWREHVHPEDLALIDRRQSIDQMEPGVPHSIEYRLKRKDGTYMTWWDRIIFIRDKETGKPIKFMGVATDITERKRAEETLQESEEKYRLLAENVTDLIYIMDMEMKVTYINPSITPLLGFSVEEGIARGLIESLTPASLGLAAKALHSVVRAEKVQPGGFQGRETVELEIYRKDGSTMWAENLVTVMRDSDGRPVGILGVTRDITERKQAEEVLHESEEKHRTLFETMAQGAVYQNAEGYIVSANPAAERILGLTLAQMMGITSTDPRWKAIHEDGSDFPGDTHPSMIALRTGKEIRHVTMGVFHPDKNEHVWISINAVPQFKTGETRPYQVYTTFDDITERRKAEEALRKSEQYFRSLFEHAGDSVYVMDIEGKHIVDCNKQASIDLGCSREEILQLSASDIEAILTPEEIIATHRRLELEESPTIKSRHRRKDGTTFPVEIRFSLPDPARPEFLIASVRDITERKQAEEALQESESRYRSLVALGAEVGEAIVMLQDEGPKEGVHVFCNETWPRITGYSNKELLNMSFFDLVHPKDRKNSLTRHRRKISGKSVPGFFEITIIRKDGTEIPVEATSAYTTYQGKPANVAYIRDITERMQAEEELQRKEEHFRSLIENASDAISILNADGTIRYQSPSYESVLGYVPEEEVGRNMLDNIHPDDVTKVSEDFARLLQDPGYTSHFEVRVRARDGSWHVLEGVSRNLLHHPAVEGIVVNLRDVTERKQAEEKLKKAMEELEHTNAEMERFTYTISHDLKSPLVTINTFLGYLSKDLSGSDAGRIEKDMLYMRGAADKMGKLLDELLEISRIGHIVNPAVTVTFHELVQEALTLVAGRIEERGAKVQVSDEPITLYGDRPRLVEIWQNLVENAVKFMGDQASPRIDIGAERRGRETVFFVRDNGIGIDPKYKSKIFGLFEKLDPNSEGVGMGLAITKRIVELYQGTIWFESEGVGPGACFWFTLPGALEDKGKGEKT
jgi:PAS domain S-box-containing protein